MIDMRANDEAFFATHIAMFYGDDITRLTKGQITKVDENVAWGTNGRENLL